MKPRNAGNKRNNSAVDGSTTAETAATTTSVEPLEDENADLRTSRQEPSLGQRRPVIHDDDDVVNPSATKRSHTAEHEQSSLPDIAAPDAGPSNPDVSSGPSLHSPLVRTTTDGATSGNEFAGSKTPGSSTPASSTRDRPTGTTPSSTPSGNTTPGIPKYRDLNVVFTCAAAPFNFGPYPTSYITCNDGVFLFGVVDANRNTNLVVLACSMDFFDRFIGRVGGSLCYFGAKITLRNAIATIVDSVLLKKVATNLHFVELATDASTTFEIRQNASAAFPTIVVRDDPNPTISSVRFISITPKGHVANEGYNDTKSKALLVRLIARVKNDKTGMMKFKAWVWGPDSKSVAKVEIVVYQPMRTVFAISPAMETSYVDALDKGTILALIGASVSRGAGCPDDFDSTIYTERLIVAGVPDNAPAARDFVAAITERLAVTHAPDVPWDARHEPTIDKDCTVAGAHIQFLDVERPFIGTRVVLPVAVTFGGITHAAHIASASVARAIFGSRVIGMDVDFTNMDGDGIKDIIYYAGKQARTATLSLSVRCAPRGPAGDGPSVLRDVVVVGATDVVT